MDRETGGCGGVNTGCREESRRAQDRDKTDCVFHLFPPCAICASAFNDVSISALVAGRGKSFEDSLMKPFGPIGTIAPAFASAHMPLRATTQAPSAGQFWFTA